VTECCAGVDRPKTRARRSVIVFVVLVTVLASACQDPSTSKTSDARPTLPAAATVAPSGGDGAPRAELEELRAALFTTDLTVAAPDALPAGTPFLDVVIHNTGPNPATDAMLLIGPGLMVVSTIHCSAEAGGLACSLGEIPARQSATVTLEVLPQHPGKTVVSATHRGTDPTPGDATREISLGP